VHLVGFIIRMIKRVCLKCDASDLYSGGARFECRPKQRLSGIPQSFRTDAVKLTFPVVHSELCPHKIFECFEWLKNKIATI